MLTLKIIYLTIYWLEAVLTVALMRRYGIDYEGNPFARWVARKAGRYAIFLFPLVFGTFFALIIQHVLFVVGFIAFHLFFLIDHIMVWRCSDRDFDKEVYKAIEVSKANAKSEIRAIIITVPIGAAVIFLAIFAYHNLTT